MAKRFFGPRRMMKRHDRGIRWRVLRYISLEASKKNLEEAGDYFSLSFVKYAFKLFR